MHFRTAHLITGMSLAAYERLFFQEKANAAICAFLRLQRRVVQHHEAHGMLQRTVCIRPQRQIPGPLRRLLGQQPLEYTEQMHYRFGSFCGAWRITPSFWAEKVRASGEVRFAAQPTGIQRIVEGEVVVQIFGMSQLLERYIVGDIERTFAQAAELTNQQGAAWLQA